MSIFNKSNITQHTVYKKLTPLLMLCQNTIKKTKTTKIPKYLRGKNVKILCSNKLLFYCVYANLFTVFAHTFKLNFTVDKCEESVV